MPPPDLQAADESTGAHAQGGRRGRISRVYWGYWLVGAAFVAQFVTSASQNYLIGIFTLPMTEDLGWTRSEFVLTRTLGQVVLALAGFFLGAHVDRHGARRLMMVGTCILAAALFLCSMVTELWQWWLLNGILLTVGGAMSGNLVVNVTLAKWFVELRGRMASTAAMGVSFGGVAVTPMAAMLIDAFGWRVAWQLLALGAFLLAFPVAFLMRRAPEDHGLHPDGKTAEEVAAGAGRAAAADYDTSLTRAQALRTPAFYLLVVAFGCGSLAITVPTVQMVPFLLDAGYSNQFGAFMIAVVSVPSMLMKPVWGWMLDRMDSKSAVLGFLNNAIALVLVLVAVHARVDWAVYVTFFLLGMGWGGLIPLQEFIWASYFGRRHLGAIRGAGLPFTLMIGATAPYLTSLYFDLVGNYDGAFLIVAGLSLFASILLQFARKPAARRTIPTHT